MSESVRNPSKKIAIGIACLVTLIVGVTMMALGTRPVRRSLAVYSELVSLGNRADLAPEARLERARALCSRRYLQSHRLVLADEGGIVGLPRNINKNFQAWMVGANVRICPTNRIGPVYQLVPEDGAWKFDGPLGMLRPRGEFIPITDLPDAKALFEDAPPGPSGP